MLRPVVRKDKDDDGDRYRGNGKPKLNRPCIANNDEELDREAQEEKEIEFEQGAINLVLSAKAVGMISVTKDLPEIPDSASSCADPQRCPCILSKQTHHRVSRR